MNPQTRPATLDGREQEHVRELLRALHSFLDAVDADRRLNARTRMAAACAAAALQKLGRDIGIVAGEWRELRCCAAEVEQRLGDLETRVAVLAEAAEEGWPAAL